MAIARVQSTSSTTIAVTNAASLALTFASPTTAGNVVIVGLSIANTKTYKVTSAHGIFSEISPPGFDTTGSVGAYIFYGVMTGADTVITIASIDGSSIVQMAAAAAEYSGVGILPDNIPAPVATIATNACNTGNLANTNANALYVGVIAIRTTTATQNTSWASNNVAPFSIAAQNTTNNASASNIDRGIVYLDAVVSTVATRGANVNHGFGANRYAGLMATFDQVVSAGGGLRTAGHGGLAS